MSIKGVKIHRGRLGSNRLGDSDSISGIVISSIGTSKISIGEPKVVYSIRDVEALNITEEFDRLNGVNVYRHLSEFFRLAGEGTELYLMLADQDSTMIHICQVEARTLIRFAKGKIRQLAIAINLKAGVQPTILNALPVNLIDAVPSAQGLAEWAYDSNMPLQIFLEGYHFTGDVTVVPNLRELGVKSGYKVSIFIGQDAFYTHKQKNPNLKKFADVGTLLGVCSKAKVHQNVGNNELFNLTDAPKRKWLEAGLSSGQSNIDLNINYELSVLNKKGYLFGIEYTGLDGVRINDDHTCVEIMHDDNNATNEHTIAYGRVHDKAVRELRKKYLPKVKSDWVVDPKTGKLPPGVIVALEDLGDQVFEDMRNRGEITFGKTKIDKDSDLLIAKELGISFEIVPKGSVGSINGKTYLKTQI